DFSSALLLFLTQGVFAPLPARNAISFVVPERLDKYKRPPNRRDGLKGRRHCDGEMVSLGPSNCRSRLKVVTIVGGRPQFIKLALVSRLLRDRGVTELIVHTGQHYDENMSQVFFDELEIAAPDLHLAVGSGRHGEQTGRMLERIEAVLLEQRPDWV